MDMKTTKINTAGWADSPFVSRDGQRLYFMYSRFNFMRAIVDPVQKPVLVGPSRLGHVADDGNPWNDSNIYVATRMPDKTFDAPKWICVGSMPMEVAGPPLTLYYTTPSPSGTRIVQRQKSLVGWGGELDLPGINLPGSNSANPHVGPNGDAIWFTSDRSGGFGGTDLWFSYKQNGSWVTPTNCGPVINTSANEDQIWFDGNSTFYFNRDGANGAIYSTSWGANRFSPPVVVNLGIPAAEVSMPDGGHEIFFGSGSLDTNLIRIMHCVGPPWGPALPVD